MAGVLEAGFGAAHAGIAAAGAGAFAVPQPGVAVGMRLCALAAHVFHHAAQVGRGFGAGLELIELVAGAAVVHQLVGIEAWALQGVEVARLQLLAGQRHQGVEHPAGVGGAAGHVDHGQAALGDEGLAQQAAGAVVVVLQAAGFGGVGAGGGDAAPGGAAAHRHHMAGHLRQAIEPHHHGLIGAGQHVEAAGALRAAQHAAFDAQHVERLGAVEAALQQIDQLMAAFQRQRRMPQQVHARCAQLALEVRRVGTQQRHAAAAAAARLQPEHVDHSVASCVASAEAGLSRPPSSSP